ncbi:MAG: hypothetical protein P4L40_23380 [Terracidiphilus sp.]|nr:hypothetical protein [Terracidiphilus sp.]
MPPSHAAILRHELTLRARAWTVGRPHVESYGSSPVVVFAPEGNCHGNFFAHSYQSLTSRPEWARRFNKVHAQGRSLPRPEDPTRRWRELDSSMSSDALLMNIFCAPGVADSPAVRALLGIDAAATPPEFGFRARIPLSSNHFDRTEVDLRWGDLLAEAKLTETNFQTARPGLVLAYRDLEAVFDPALLPTAALPAARQRTAAEYPEDYSQEEVRVAPEDWQPTQQDPPRATTPGFASYQLVRNVLAAHALGLRFAVLLDQRRPDLLEAWFQVLGAVRSAALRTRLLTLSWQELAPVLPPGLRDFLDLKYGIVGPNENASPIPGYAI